MKLYFLDDGTGVRPPARFAVQAWTPDGWVDIPDQRRTPARPEGRRPNIVSFTPITASRLRFVFVPQAGGATGLTEIEAWAHTGLPLPEPKAAVPDLAFGARASASFTSRWDRVSEVNDGYIDFTAQSRNRWTAYGSPNRSDWVEIDLPALRTVRALDLYLWGDGSGVKAPRRYAVQVWDEAAARWTAARVRSQVPARPRASALNTVRIAPVRTAKIRVVFEHDLPAFSGVTELMIWDTLP